MRARLVVVVVIGLASRASADSRLKNLLTGYEKEAASCQIHADGVAKVRDGTQKLFDETKDPSLEGDRVELAVGHGEVQTYCDAVTSAVQFLQSSDGASYKSLEKELDERDNKIRKLRKSSKQTLDKLQPVIQRMIPKINARVGSAVPVEKKLPGTFPSGRKVDLPALPGTWKVSGSSATDTVEYTEQKLVATVSVRPFSAATCDQQRKSLTARADHLDDVEQTDSTKKLKIVWNVAYTKNARVVQVACVEGKAGGWLATIDAPIDAKLPLGTVMARMLAAQIAQP
ncbi:MAG: hypothetical protein JWO36_7152 [Myxococcales bacterium]|nr:hypothetical protein [Myxococcales bacterium]